MKSPNMAPKEGISWLFVSESTPLHEVLRRYEGATERGLPAGIALVVDASGRLLGTVTDGDIRRSLLRTRTLDAPATEAMRSSPITFPDHLSHQALLKLLPKELERRGRRGRAFLGKVVLVDVEGRPTRVLDYHQLWEQRVATHRHVVVVGLGYVGLTLALRLSELGFRVTGVDVDAKKVEGLLRGESHVHEQGLVELLREQLEGNFRPQTQIPSDGDVFVIAVGTPVERRASGDHEPDLAALDASVSMVATHVRSGSLVVLRSTVPIGTTREFVAPRIAELSGLRAGIDFHLAFAPERTLEGRALKELSELPQVIGGLNEDSVEATVALFRELTPTIVRMESLEAAEMAKLINNSYRDVIFGFANEMAQVAKAFNLDVSEVISAANRGYPRDPVPLPSPGVGGPCLTKDPYILASAASRAGIRSTLSHQGRRVNESMHAFVVDAIIDELVNLGKDPAKSAILVLGLAFKGHPETADIRNSSSLEIAQLLRAKVAYLAVHDPIVRASEIKDAGFEAVEIPRAFDGVDAAVFLNNHAFYRKVNVFSMVRALRAPGIVYDAWRLFRGDEILGACPCAYMGLGFVRRTPGMVTEGQARAGTSS